MGSPIISTLIMLGGGDRPAVRASPRTATAASASALLLLMTGLLGWWLGPMLNFALALKNGMQLIGYAAVGTGAIFFAMGAHRDDDQARLQLHGQVPVRRHDRAAGGDDRQHVPADPGARADDLDAGDRGVLAVPAARPVAHRERRRDQLHHGDDGRLHEPVQHLRQPAASADGAGGRARLTGQPGKYGKGACGRPFRF